MSEQGAAAVVAAEEWPHGIIDLLQLAHRGTKGVTRWRGLVHSWANRHWQGFLDITLHRLHPL
jgi:hypothetical protein